METLDSFRQRTCLPCPISTTATIRFRAGFRLGHRVTINTASSQILGADSLGGPVVQLSHIVHHCTRDQPGDVAHARFTLHWQMTIESESVENGRAL